MKLGHESVVALVDELLGPEASQPSPKICSKCGTPAECWIWETYPAWYAYPHIYARTRDMQPDVHKCQIHGCFVSLNGPWAAGLEIQIFDEPDVFVLGPNGEKLFEF